MRFGLTDAQHRIQRTARKLLSARSPIQRVREAAESATYDPELWAEIVELGWAGIALAEEYGGAGYGAAELNVIAEELGYALAGTPFLGSAVAGQAIAIAGSQSQRDQWLPGLASGNVRGCFAVAGPDGTAHLVPDADTADVFVVLSPDWTEGQLLTREQAHVVTVSTVDGTRRYGDVSGAGESLVADRCSEALDRALVVVSAEMVGISQRALDMGVAYVKDRHQFGQPVGAFQGVSHRCVEMLRATETARSATDYAAWAADADGERLAEVAAMAKLTASQAARDVTAANIQVHGGVGFSWAGDPHWLFKRALLDSQYLGGPDAHRGRLARLTAQRLRGGARLAERFEPNAKQE
jgi:alkylation response protein AidB-like acyl-CoA dehydrogenase